MRMDRVGNLIRRGLQGHSQAHFGDQFRGLRPDDVGAQNLPMRFSDENFHHPLGVPAGHGPATGPIREPADLELQLLLLRRGLGEANAGHLRLAVGAAWEGRHLFRLVLGVKNSVYRLNGLKGGHVGEPRRSDNVPRRKNSRHGGLVPRIRLHVPAVEFQLHPGIERPLQVRLHPHRAEQGLRFKGFGILARQLHLHARGGDRTAFHGDLGQDGDPLLGQTLAEQIGNLLILHRQDPGLHFHQGHLGPEGVQEIRKLHTDGAGPEDHDAFGLLLHLQGLAAGHHLLAVHLEPGQHPG